MNKKSSQNKKVALPKEVINLLNAPNVEHINIENYWEAMIATRIRITMIHFLSIWT